MDGGTVMPPPPGDLGPAGAPGELAVPGPGGGPGGAPDISAERLQGMPQGPTPALAARMAAGATIGENSEYALLTDEQIDAMLQRCAASIDDIEFRKRMRRTASEQKKNRKFEVEDSSMLKTAAAGEKVVIDRVPPKFRRDILNSQ
jgi:hypothetical protein